MQSAMPKQDINATDDEMSRALFTFMAEGLIHISRQDGEDSAEMISKNLGSLQHLLMTMKNNIEEQPDAINSQDLTMELNQALSQITDSIISLQFFDRVSQRLVHAIEYLQSGPNAAEIKWSSDPKLNLQNIIFKLYTVLSIDDEKKLFEAIQDGVPIGDAIKLSISQLNANIDNDDNIDLF